MARNEENLGKIAEKISKCTKCPLHESRTNTVPGHGSESPRVVFIGEAPGKKEDETGLPFVGRAGVLLDEMLARAGLEREEVFICNILKCRPPKNRNPRKEEIATCTPYLERQMQLRRPEVVCTLGNYAMQFVFSNATGVGAPRIGGSSTDSCIAAGTGGISKIHGQIFHIRLFDRPLKFMPLYHPAATIYNRKLIPEMEADFGKLGEMLK
jgi:DNA polymerase